MLEVCALSEVFTTPSLLHDQTDHRYRQLLIESRSHKLRAVELLTLAQFRAGVMFLGTLSSPAPGDATRP